MAYRNQETGATSAGNLAEFVLAYELSNNVDCTSETGVLKEEILKEIEENSDRVQKIRKECAAVIPQLPGDVIKVILAGGDSRCKSDLIVETKEGTFHINLKRDNNAPERRQGQSWDNVRETYEQFGFDMSGLRDRYVRAAEVFTVGHLRYSSKPGDWTPELGRAADTAQGFFAEAEAVLAARGVDPEKLVSGLQDIILGDAETIYHVELKKGSVHKVGRGPVTLGELTLQATKSASGRTTKLRVFSDGELIFYTENSVKAGKATKKQAAAGGHQPSRDVRSICPQTKLSVTKAGLELLSN